MQINKISLYHLDMPLAHPFETSFGLETHRECILVAAEAGGRVGWGECAALDRPSYSSETTGTAWHILRDFLIPIALKTHWDTIEDFLQPLVWVRGNRMARAGLQGAAWDILARKEDLSLAASLSRPYPEGPRTRVPVGVSIGIQPTVGDTLERIDKFLGEGFSRVKLKIKPGWDLALLEAVRKSYPDLALMVDANSAYNWGDLDLLRELDAFDLIMLEQPLAHDDLFQHSQLARQIRTPICLDESIETPEQAAFALKIGACQMINIKPGRVGGLWQTRQIHDLCREQGVPVWCGGMLETGVGRAANLAAASLPNFILPTDNGPTARYWEEDIIEEQFTLNREDSTITVPALPGLGVTPSLERVRRYLLREEHFAA